MDTYFETRYYANQKMLAEFNRKYGIGPRPLTVCFTIVIYAVCVVQSLWSDILVEMLPMLLSMGIVLSAVYFFPNYFAWASLRNAKKQNDNVLPETAVTFGQTIEIHEGMVHLTIEYRKIQKVVRLKHSYVLMNGKRTGIIVDPNGFAKGTFEGFKAFLRERCPDLVIPE